MATSVSTPERTASLGPVQITSSTRASKSSRTIVTLVALAGGIALISNELETGVTGSKVSTAQHASGAKIILGATVSGVTLTLLSHAGDAGQTFATGLAVVLFLSSALVYGGPFFKLVGSVTSTSKPSTPTKPVTATAKG